MFKCSGSIKNEPGKPKRRILSAREERYVLNKIRKSPKLSARNSEELLKILCVTKQFVVCFINMTFMVGKKKPLVSRRNRENRVLFAEEHLDKDKKLERRNLVR